MSDYVTDRRGLIGAGVLAAGAAGMVGSPASAQASGGWQPTDEKLDQWYEAQPGHRHRMVFDTVSVDQAQATLGYANNSYVATTKGYGGKPQELGMIIIMRHASTPFAYNDAMWKKYGKLFAKNLKLQGADAIRATSMNPWLARDPDDGPVPKGMEDFADPSIGALAAKGARFAVCGLATEGIAMQLAGATKGDAKAIEAELRANLVPGGNMVPAGIIAVNRAQEHGYTLAIVG
ncbi:hypothetical protein [Sphingomonas jaspsi]|uniref:hypothetical protein n=1 Tax=Sphingomonas jaspsi TaxID=392409 RepID=UPI0004ACF677|nr:hypothetical protein [Sphingomonas jaspsi]